jgi:PLP dependent protein
MSDISNTIDTIFSRIGVACNKVGVDKSSINLIVVSKTQTSESVAQVVACNLFEFAENQLQDAETKIPYSSSSIRWHFIGRIQRNKVNKILKLFPIIHSVDSLELASIMDRKAREFDLSPQIFLQVNLAHELSKSGFDENDLVEALPELVKLKNLKICGLMCIPPLTNTPECSRKWFKKLRLLRDSIEKFYGIKMPYLSMGMSDDFEIAIEEGATHIRLGSCIFGPRNVS